MELQINIREAKPEEAVCLSEIGYKSKKFWKYPDELMELWKDDLTITSDFISAHTVRYAVVKSTVIGFYALAKSDPGFKLEHLWIGPDYIGKGVGSKLFDDAVTFVAEQDGGGGVLHILSDPNSEEFYLKKGARKISSVLSKPEGWSSLLGGQRYRHLSAYKSFVYVFIADAIEDNRPGNRLFSSFLLNDANRCFPSAHILMIPDSRRFLR